MHRPTVKVIRYRLRDGCEERAFLEASEALVPELATLDGFMGRELQRAEDGGWADIVYWRTREDADRSESRIQGLPTCTRCIAMMDAATMTVTHLELVQDSGRVASVAA